MRIFLSIFSLYIFVGCSSDKNSNDYLRLAGMYKLLVIERQDLGGIWHTEGWANGGDSYIVYDGKGHMAVQITPKGYKNFNWMDESSAIDEEKVKLKTDSLSTEELKAAVKEFASCYTYFGNYSINDSGQVTHERLASTIPVIWGTTVKRNYSFSGDTLTLINVADRRRLVWIRQN